MGLALVGRLVLEQLDVRAVTDTEHGDLVDHGPRIDVEQVVHERARWIAERPERQRRTRAHHVLEPLHRLVDVGNREPDVVHADEPEPAEAIVKRSRDRCTRSAGSEERRTRGYRSNLRAVREELPPPPSPPRRHPLLPSLPRLENRWS